MLARMRQPRHSAVAVEWGAQPVWQTQLPANVYGGDTVIAFAGFASPCELTPRLTAQDEQGHRETLSSTDRITESSGSALPRMAAARRMAQCEGQGSHAPALALALSHQLLSAQTHCILVHVRNADGKATDAAQLHQVPSMLAAGWGATSSVMAGAMAAGAAAGMAVPAMPAMPAPAGRAGGLVVQEMQDVRFSLIEETDFSDAAESTAPAFSRLRPGVDELVTLRELAESIRSHLQGGHGLTAALDQHCRTHRLHDDLRAAIDEVGAGNPEPSLAWLLLAHWINTRSGGLHDATLANVLAPELGRLDSTAVDAALRVFDRSLGLYGLDDWTSTRLRRLGRSLRQIVA